ncbi:MAG TPA: amino acid adenylation domain-containing protein, partial [Herpetosiphonaceae bacterium]
LSAWSKSPHFTINVPRFNRLPLHDEVTSIIGEFASFTLLEVDQRAPAPFARRAQDIQEQLWQDLEHQYVSGVRVLREMARAQGIVTGAAMPVVFTSVLNLNMTIQAASAFDRLGELVFSIAQTPQVWLDFTVGEDGGTLFFHWDAVDELFPAGMFDAMFAAYCDFLRRLADDEAAWEAPTRQLVPAEQLEQRAEINATQRDYPAHESLHGLIEAQVERTPDAVAVIAEAGTRERVALSYRELNARANQLARHLQTLGVKTNTLVGIAMERSLEMVVGLLGVLKAGAAYVPIDPSYPAERVQWMLDDAQVPVLLTQERLIAQLPEHAATTLCLDRDWPAIAENDEHNLPPTTQPDDLAYVIYTSGSTGRPKGAMNTHRAIANRLLWMQDTYGLTAEDRVLQKTPFSFDVSVWEFFWPLLTGARLVMARPGGHQDPAYLADVIAQQQITTLHFVPSMLEHFLDAPNLSQCRSLRRVICSGEALSFELTRRFFERLSAELHNLYGPTEAAVDVTSWACDPNDERRVVPIGYPIANTQLHIIDQQMQPVPLWVPGELLIGGVQLARGYLNRPDLTAERFIPDPFSTTPGSRLYRTGDLARFREDGSIEYLGRLDHQVKLRGFRIELGEIEATLRTYPGLREAVVVAREDQPGDQRLIAYVVEEPRTGALWAKQEPNEQTNKEQTNKGVETDSSPSPAAAGEGGVERSETGVRAGEDLLPALRAFLGQRLPEYMIPSAFVVLDALPLSPNGKVDRKALPAPDSTRPELATGYVEPRSAVEQVVAGVWTDIVGVEQVGVFDNFFTLGGNSLHVIQVLTRLRQIFHVDLPARSLLEAPTVDELAQRILALETRPGQIDRIAQVAQRVMRLSAEEKQKLRQQTTILEEKLA